MHSQIVAWNAGNLLLASSTEISRAERLKSGVVANGRFPSNFYHGMVGILPKVFALRVLSGVPKEVPLLVSGSLKGGALEEALRLILGASREITFLADIPHTVEDAYLLESPVPEITHLTGKQAIPWQRLGSFNFSLMQEFRQFFLQNALGEKPEYLADKAPRIFLRRSGASRSFNSGPVEQMLVEEGFRVVDIEKHSFLEQVRIFRSAELIVSATGAQWAGSLFAEGAKCLVIQPEFLGGSTLFSKLLSLGNSELFEFPMAVKEKSWSEYFHSRREGYVDVEALKKAITSGFL